MRRYIQYLILINLLALMVSCNKNQDVNIYNSDYRIGLWISPDVGDTLQFVDEINLIRKGYNNGNETFTYRIDEGKLIVKPPDSPYEFQHRIIEAESEMVKLSGMYFTTGLFYDGSGIYFKEMK